MERDKQKLVVVVKDNLDTGKAMNAVAHTVLGFGSGVVSKEDVHLNEYVDAEGNKHKNISEMPLIVLKASSNKIRNLRRLALDNDVKFVDFTDTMTAGTYEEEYELTKSKKDEDLDYWVIALYGDVSLIGEWTRKFSLYR